MSLFLPIERTKEINTYKIWEKATSFGAQVAVPKINRKTEEMKHLLFETEDQLEISDWGIPEPSKGRVIAAEHFDIVIVPLLVADKGGNRVGYGKGYYDKYLTNKNVVTVGVCYDFQVVDELPKENHDVKLDILITDKSIYRW